MNNVPMGIQIYTLAMYEVEFVEKELKKYNLDKHQFLYLIIPFVFPGIVQSTAAQYFNVNKSTAGRMFVKLEKKGYLSREKATNERDFNIYLTKEGETLKDAIFQSVQHYEDIMLQNFENKEELRNIVNDMFNSARKSRKEGGYKNLWNMIKK
jgi:DNA-binding MarR family transcriptional regulator